MVVPYSLWFKAGLEFKVYLGCLNMCTGIQEPPGRGRVVLVSCITYSINAASNGGFMDPIITICMIHTIQLKHAYYFT